MGGTGIPYEYCEYPQEFNNCLKESIRKRDEYKCRICGKKRKYHNLVSKKLDIHHVNYNKNDCKSNNLISLCASCHRKTNFDRDYWYAYFTYIMENR
jgi:5-methylcytosine-specific restriction endonuclease McrA